MPATIHDDVLAYDDVRRRLATGRANLLLGNGFSIGCDPIFTYGSLYQAALAAGLSPRAQAVFARLGTNNFEGVMRLLEDAHYVAATYGLVNAETSDMLGDLDVVKKALVAAVARSHLPHTGTVPDERKAAAARFIEPYYNVFTTNYDLLAYWVNMAASDSPPFGDGFREDRENPEALSVVFSEKLGGDRGLFYLHGGLHLFTEAGALRKHCWSRSHRPLMELILEAMNSGGYPLFVAEGTPDKKLEQIRGNAYLSYALSKLGRIESPLVIYGSALGPSDAHIMDAVADNRRLKQLYVGLFGDGESASNLATRQAVASMADRWTQQTGTRRNTYSLDVYFYDSQTAHCWE